ncbi:hypothetical protein JQX09_21495 [Sulfitobacter pseudonitzschiae]|uniref:AB hydrolase-1 domain-containing protein n=1 Tax=Pseudosulfitobacter pseudonitzschiae TaxID=1402135 RepID=A0A9Q2NPT3_9RHOB|nr:alpha/beta fold hydrolase [Pseudosulfitobacter pseudonitzschiae]MBM2294502.1 hypothetical protein [Pseudosulfitobacter pseudonitzschiae]MBM2299470.1 hypothetical protein [Pseudosulfitobacter pseudonitzschiae]MBM2304334.1 hypothetical protein [Pseudosulfitobacter pseudonitzschiae]MBM2314114.1 hypothetical protein [Pseudosulfitobacter pseudonitzschiae]MBM2319029.1 hypothetical protein [Pseudosulfitobacter pseudonitzschiae]
MTQDAQEAIAKANAAHRRAMAMPRLLDYGMDFADATALFARTDAGEPWDAVAAELGRARLAKADVAEGEGHSLTSAGERQRGIAALVFAQMAFNFDIPEKRALYGELVSACAALTRVSDMPFNRCEIPFGGKHLIGWLLRPSTPRADGTVILFGGQTGWGVAYLPVARALARRNLAALLIEGPGQGETRIEQGIYLDADTDAAFSACVDAILDDPTLGAPGIWGNSYGGLFAARTAAHDSRVAACCVNGSFATPGILPFRSAFEQSAAMLGTEDRDAIDANFARLRFDPGTMPIRCPLLVLHGGADPLVDLSDQQPFLDAATGEARLETWPDGDHTIYNHGFDRTTLAADWFAARLSTR